MHIKPVIKGSMSLMAHPYGLKKDMENQISYLKEEKKITGSKKALVVGASSGYGLATRLVLAFCMNADTIGLSFESGIIKKRTGTPGWWNNIWFKKYAEKERLIAKNFVDDSFTNELKEEVIEYIKEEFGGKIDLLVYSLAAGKRKDPKTGKIYNSTLKSTTEKLELQTLNIEKEEMCPAIVKKATLEEIEGTVKVMGGEDWKIWIEMLKKADLLADNFKTISYSYIGSKITAPIYRNGTIGEAKKDLEETALVINQHLKSLNGEAFSVSAKAIVSRASAFIPVFPIYVSTLFKVMKEKNIHETTTQHVYRFFKDMLYGKKRELDSLNRMRPDNFELRDDVQKEVEKLIKKINKDNFKDLIEVEKLKKEFLQLSGFEIEGIDYEKDVDIEKLKKYNF